MWSPFLAGDIDALERVQHRATKLIPTIANLPYKQRLKILNLQSLYSRRVRGDLIETYKILNELTGTHINNYFTLNTNSITRGHSMKLLKEKSRLNISKYFFLIELSTAGMVYPSMSLMLNLLILSKIALIIIGRLLDMDTFKGLWPN